MIRVRFDRTERAYRVDEYPLLEREDGEVLVTVFVTYQAPHEATETDPAVPEEIVDPYARKDGAPFELTAGEEHEISNDYALVEALREAVRS